MLPASRSADAEDDRLILYPTADPRAPEEHVADEQKSVDFWGAFRIIFNRKFMILAIVIMGVAAAAVMTLRETPMYRAASTIEVQAQETRILEGTSVGPNVVADGEYMATQYSLLQSRSLAERVAESLNLVSNPRFSNPNASREARLRQSIGAVLGNLEVTPSGRSRIIQVSYISPHADDAAMIANAVVDQFIQGSLERKYNTTEYARNFLEERLVVAEAALADAERRLVEYAQEEDIVDIGDTAGIGTLDVNSLVALNDELAIAQGEKLRVEQRYRETTSGTTSQVFLESEDLKRVRALKSALRAEYQEKLGTFKPDYPDMLKLQSRIEALDVEMEEERQAIVLAAESAYRAAVAREQSLIARINELKSSVQQERGRRIDYTILQREVDTARSQHEALLQRLKEVSIADGVGSSQISIVDRAIVPGYPFAPNMNNNLIRALILSLALGVALAFILNYLDDTIRTPEDVKTKLGLNSIGVIPKVKGRASNMTEAIENPRSPLSEAFFSARTAIALSPDGGAPRSIAVTSTRAAEGKSTAALSLGLSFARGGQNVLVIDADMRKPSIVAHSDQSKGVHGILTEDLEWTEQVVSSVVDNLDMLPCGSIPVSPAELLASDRFVYLLEDAMEVYDIVIVDSPPVLGFADAPIIGSRCEASLILIESGGVRKSAVQRTLERMLFANANIIGAILSKFDAKKAGQSSAEYYYAYGGGSYDYGHSKLPRNLASAAILPPQSKAAVEETSQQVESQPDAIDDEDAGPNLKKL